MGQPQGFIHYCHGDRPNFEAQKQVRKAAMTLAVSVVVKFKPWPYDFYINTPFPLHMPSIGKFVFLIFRHSVMEFSRGKRRDSLSTIWSNNGLCWQQTISVWRIKQRNWLA